MPTGINIGMGLSQSQFAGWWQQGSVLDLDFANNLAYNSMDRTKLNPTSALTYTAPSPKMVYGSDGVLRYAPHNLLQRSQEFDNASWVKTNATISANAAVAPDGTTTADTLTGSGSPATQRISQNPLATGAHTFTVYAKANTNNFMQLVQASDAAFFANFDLSTGSVGTKGAGTTSSIQDVGGGWYRCSATWTIASSSSHMVYLVEGASASYGAFFSTANSIYVWGAQLVAGASALTYIPTTSAARYSLPIDHDPVTLAPLGVLIEEQRTNLLTYSEQFDNAAWVKSNASVTGASINAAVAPNGTLTADKLVEGVGTLRKYITQSSAAANQTFSLYAQKGERNYVAIGHTNIGGLWAVSLFDLNLGTYVNSYQAGGEAVPTNNTITPVGDGWYRISCTLNGSATLTSTVIMVSNGGDPIFEGYTGNGTSGIYIWGAQLEAGAFATSYIPTVASQVTRAADQVSILTSAFGYNAAAGTVYAEADSYNENGTTWSLSDGTNNERIVSNAGATYHLGVFDGGVQQTSIDVGTVPTDGTQYKCAAAFTADEFGYSLDGGSVGTDVGGTLPTVTSLRLGMGASTTTVQINGHIKRLTYFPVRKTNAELVVLST